MDVQRQHAAAATARMWDVVDLCLRLYTQLDMHIVRYADPARAAMVPLPLLRSRNGNMMPPSLLQLLVCETLQTCACSCTPSVLHTITDAGSARAAHGSTGAAASATAAQRQHAAVAAAAAGTRNIVDMCMQL